MHKIYSKKLLRVPIGAITIAMSVLLIACSYAVSPVKNNPANNARKTIIDAKFKVHYINVDHGDSILIQCEGRNMLIDAGTIEHGDEVVKYLQNQGVKKLDYLVVTHSDKDHIGGMSEVIEDFDIDTVYMRTEAPGDNKMKNTLKALVERNKKAELPKVGDVFKLGSASCTVYAPNSSEYKDKNNYSIVIKVVYGQNSFLFTGDALKESEKEMIDKDFNLSADVLKVAHHGLSDGTSQGFLDKVNPKYAVVSLGNEDESEFQKKTLKKLNDKNIKIYKTDEDGNIVAASDGKQISFYKNVQ